MCQAVKGAAVDAGLTSGDTCTIHCAAQCPCSLDLSRAAPTVMCLSTDVTQACMHAKASWVADQLRLRVPGAHSSKATAPNAADLPLLAQARDSGPLDSSSNVWRLAAEQLLHRITCCLIALRAISDAGQRASCACMHACVHSPAITLENRIVRNVPERVTVTSCA